MIIMGIDVGPTNSAYACMEAGTVGRHAWIANEQMIQLLRGKLVAADVVVLESPQAQDRPLGKLLRDTIWFAARFAEILDSQARRWLEADERDVALWITGNRSANNAALLQSLKDHFGDTAQKPCDYCHSEGQVQGKRDLKKCPQCKGRKYMHMAGPLAGLNEHERSGLGAALWYERRYEHRQAS